MEKRSLFSSFFIQFFSLIFLSLIFVKQSSASPKSHTFVVLPFNTDSNLIELRNSFTDILIEKLKTAGFNAIGTRYLTSILNMENCNTDDCMRKIASIVGAQYLIYGSINGDTVAFSVTIHVKDITNDKELSSIEKMLVGGFQAAALLSDDLTTMISSLIKKDDSLPAPSVLSSKNETEISEKQNESQSINTIQDTLENQNVPGSDYTNSVASDYHESDTQDIVDSSGKELILSHNVQSRTDTLKTKALNPDQSIESEQSEPINNSEQTHELIAKNTISDTSTKSSDPREAFLPPHYGKKSILKPLPSRLSQQSFRGARLLVFGNIAAVGLIGGLLLNDQVKQSLKKETELYSKHENADAAHSAATYYNYVKQTEKSDKYSKIRNALYSVSGVCAIGFSVSVFF